MQIKKVSEDKGFNIRLTALAAGFFAFILFLEIVIRGGGAVFCFFQDIRNSRSAKQKNAYKILCLGESTTAGQYPGMLEDILNGSGLGVRFSVIDKGFVGANTGLILAQLEKNLAEYEPDMVTIMAGANDAGTVYYKDIPEASSWLFRNVRVYRFIRTLFMQAENRIKGRDPGTARDPAPGAGYLAAGWASRERNKSDEALADFLRALSVDPENEAAYFSLGLLYKEMGRGEDAKAALEKGTRISLTNAGSLDHMHNARGSDGKFAPAENFYKRKIEAGSKDAADYCALGLLYQVQYKLSGAENMFLAAVSFDPASYDACLGLGWIYMFTGDSGRSEKFFRKASEINPGDDKAHCGLGQLFESSGRLGLAEDSFKKAIEMNPLNDTAHFGLGWINRLQGKFADAAVYFERAVELDPLNFKACFGLGWVYRNLGRYREAESALKRALEIDPGQYKVYLELGYFYLDRGKFVQARDTFIKAVKADPDNYLGFEALDRLYSGSGDARRAAAYRAKVAELKGEYCKGVTARNYLKMKDMLDKRSVRFVCIQYPMRSVAPLRRIFNEGDNVIFVDNEKIFSGEIAEYGLREVFRDMSGIDFGHCTEKGNRILAGNIAGVILKEVFNHEK